jgi:uncharacterized sulfatase
MRLTRRAFVGTGLAAGGCAICAAARAAPLTYDLDIREIAPRTFAAFGARETFSLANGGNIVNTAFIDTGAGVVVIDTGPSRRYGETLRAAIAAKAPGKPLLRVFNTHHHPDHCLGNQAFPAATLAASAGTIDGLTREGEAFASGLYRLIGDWMRGTHVVVPQVTVAASVEVIGGRRFQLFDLGGHTAADLVIKDMDTGVVFTGDLAFLDRAPTTPHADLPRWLAALDTLAGLDRSALLPGHGPLDRGQAALDQTRDWLGWLDGTLREALARGETMNEAALRPLPKRFSALGVAQLEYERSVMHLYPRLEAQMLTPVALVR